MRSSDILAFLIVSSLLNGVLLSQTRTDPRAMALCGAYGTVSRGLFCVDYNPANLAIKDGVSEVRLIAGAGFSVINNFLSIKRYKKYNGKDFEANDQRLKKAFLSEIPDVGWRIFMDLHVPVPMVNYSKGNHAITYDILLISDIGIAKDLVRFLVEGNEVNKTLDLRMNEEIVGIGQWAFSFGVPFKDFNIGFSFKYLQGLLYMGFNPDSSFGYITTHFTPEKNYIEGEGRYYFQQTVGGMGYSFDIGLTSRLINGYRLGISLSNVFGRIYWNKRTLLARLVKPEEILPFEGDFYEYRFRVNEARFDKFFQGIPYSEIIVGEGRTFRDTSVFIMKYPALFRFSVSKVIEDVVLTSDFVAGFQDRLYSFGRWKFAIGVEVLRSVKAPVRMGVSVGGKEIREFALGGGYHLGLVNIDWAVGFCNGFILRKMQGVKFSFLVYTSKL